MRHYATKADWMNCIPACRFTVNTATTSSHGTFPFKLVERCKPRIPIDNKLAVPSILKKTTQMKLAEETMSMYQKEMKDKYNEKVSKWKLQNGSFIIIRNHFLDGKLDV